LEKLFGVLFSVCRGTPKQGEWVVACLQGAWPKIIGDRLAAVCAPASFDGSVLVIEAQDRQWEEAVRSVRPALLEKLQSVTAGEVKRIQVIGRQLAESNNQKPNPD
jgi:hypothetical protein